PRAREHPHNVPLSLHDALPIYQEPPWNEQTGPAPGQFSTNSNGYELPIAMEVRRGRYLDSFEHPHALTPNKPRRWDIPLRDRDRSEEHTSELQSHLNLVCRLLL